ncbi:MAG: HAMP domain-containing sensor histidine kinase [Bacteroidota bacterium]
MIQSILAYKKNELIISYFKLLSYFSLLIQFYSCGFDNSPPENIDALYQKIHETTYAFPDSAMLLIEQCIEQTERSRDDYYHIMCLREKSEIARNRGKYEESIEILDLALAILQKDTNDTLQSEILREKFWAYYTQGDEEKYKASLLESEQFNTQIQYDEGLSFVYNMKLFFSLNAFESGDSTQRDSILLFYNRGTSLLDSEDNELQISPFQRNIARYYRTIGQLDTAISLMLSTIPYHKGNDKDLYNLYSIYQTISYFYKEKGDIPNTVKYLNLAIGITEQMDYNWTKRISYNQLGVVYEEFQLHRKAIDIYKYVIEDLTLPEKDSSSLVEYFSKIGQNYSKLGIGDSSRYYLEKALSISAQVEDNDSLVLSLAHLYYADYLQEEGKLELAMSEIATAQALNINLSENYSEEINLNTNLLLAKIQEKNRKYDQIPQLAQSALNLLDKTNNIHISHPIDLRLTALSLLSDYYQDRGDYKQANYYLDQSKEVLAKINEVSQSVLLIDLAQEVEKSREQFESRSLKLEKEIQAERLLVQRQLNWVLLVGIFLSLALLAIVWYFFKKSKKDNKVIQQQSEKLTELNELKNKVFAIIGHDLRGPVGGIKLALDMTTEGQISKEDFLDMTEDMQKNATAVYEILNNLLNWANIQIKGLGEVSNTATDLDEQVEIVRRFLSSLLHEKQIHFEVLSNDLSVKADANDVNILLRNLINNAIKFTPKGGKISVSAEAKDHAVVITVSDTGIGIPEDKISTIFELGGSTFGTSGERGTGIGLNLCKEIVEKYNGEIGVKSEQGKGSHFYFTLPDVELD